MPATFINSLIRFLEAQLAIAFRTRLVNYTYGLYFKNQTFYRVSNLDTRLENADHSLTDDVAAFTNSCAHLYSSVSKPTLDTIVIARSLKNVSSFIKQRMLYRSPKLTFVARAHPRLHKSFCRAAPSVGHPGDGRDTQGRRAQVRRFRRRRGQQKGLLQVDYIRAQEMRNLHFNLHRHVHTRIITSAEEIAFYGGQDVELSALRKAYRSLVRQTRRILNQRLWFVMLEQFMMKYGWAGNRLERSDRKR